MTTLTIPRRPPVSLNRQERMHWSKRRQYRALYARESHLAWHQAGQPTYDRPVVTVRCYSRGDRIIRDRDNLYGAVKPLIDGLKGYAFPEDSMAVIDLRVEAHVVTRGEWIEIEIEIEERP